MCASLALDVPTASRLAEVDPALALLPGALPVEEVGVTWRLHDVSWEPGTGCRLAFHVERPRAQPTFVSVVVTSSHVRRTDYRRDPQLPGLGRATDPVWVAHRLASASDEPILACEVHPVRYRPGSRCVLRYRVSTATGSHELLAKTWEPQSFAHASRPLALLADSVAARRLVPARVALWPEAQTAVTAAVTGRTVSSLLGDGAVPAADRARLAHRLGGVLARFHQVPDVGAPRWSAADQLASLDLSAGALRSGDGDVGRRLSALYDVLASRVPEKDRTVLGHGGFRAGQVIRSADGRLVLLDLDGLCRCPPGHDLGAGLAHLRWQGIRHPTQRKVLRAAERAMLSGYRARGGEADPDSLLWWWAAGMLQVALRRYRRLEVVDWPAVPALLDATAELLVARQSRSAPDGATNLLDPREMTTVLRLALGAAATSPRNLVVEAAESLPSAPGKRAVVRYRVRGLFDEGPVLLVGKCFRDSRRARLLDEHLRLLHGGPLGEGALRVPEPLGLLPDQRLVLYRHCAGTPLNRIRDPLQVADGVRQAAQWLARLHGSAVRFPRRLSVPAEVDSVRAWAAVVGQRQPALAQSAHRLASAWAEVASTLPEVAAVPIHKDFHPGHVLLGEPTWVIDLDEARQGDPAFDVAHFCAHLELTYEKPHSEQLAEVFIREYRAGSDWGDSGSLGPFLAYTWLKIARQWAVGSGPGRDASPAERAAGATLALGRGWQCLVRSSTSCAAGRVSHRPSS